MTDVFTRLKELWKATSKSMWRANHGNFKSHGGSRKYSYIEDAEQILIAHEGGRILCEPGNAEFIAFAHNNVPQILAEVERLQASVENRDIAFRMTFEAHQALANENTELKARIEKMEWALQDLTKGVGKFLMARHVSTETEIQARLRDLEKNMALANQILGGGDDN